ncbi:MAG: hypothetical protein ACT4QA_15535 [Panacagrimonas sp.]
MTMIEQDSFQWRASTRHIENGYIPLRVLRLSPQARSRIRAMTGSANDTEVALKFMERHLLFPSTQRIRLPTPDDTVDEVVVLPSEIRLGSSTGWLYRLQSGVRLTAHCESLWISPLIPAYGFFTSALQESHARSAHRNDLAHATSVEAVLQNEWQRVVEWGKAMAGLRHRGFDGLLVNQLTEDIAIPVIESIWLAERNLITPLFPADVCALPPIKRPDFTDLVRLRNREQALRAYPSLGRLWPFFSRDEIHDAERDHMKIDHDEMKIMHAIDRESWPRESAQCGRWIFCLMRR